MIEFFICAGVIFALFIFFLILGGVFTVEQQKVAVIERFGKFARTAGPGLHFKIPIAETIRARISLRILQLDVRAETKTQDNVFVSIVVAVQYAVINDKVFEATYKLSDPTSQINSYVFDVVRAKVPKITIDELFERKDEIAMAVKEELNETMINFGFEIINSLVTDIEPDAKVKDAMNEINAAQRLRIAANEKGEAEKILKVKQAEAEAESKALQGVGVANQRKAIIEGLQESVENFQESIKGTTAQDVMNLVLITQYFDMIKDVGDNSKTNTILIPHSPGGISDLAAQVRDSMVIANEIDKGSKK